MSLKKNYIIVEEIGSGSMATISKAIQKSLDRFVAIKEIHPHLSSESEYISRFEREAKAAAGLAHMNIMDIIDFGQDEGRYFIVIEYIDGPTLHSVLSSCEKLPIDVTLSIIIQVLNGLEYGHNKGVIHRDIKPANIMINSTGIAKITDFGIAQAADLPSLTQVGQKIGTPSYMSPEQAQGKKIDQRSDLFAVGIVLYQSLAHTLPFPGDTLVTVFKNIIETPHPPLNGLNPDVPEGLSKIIDKALSKERTRRFFDAAEFVHALETFAFDARIMTGPRVIQQFLKENEIIPGEKTDELTPSKIRQQASSSSTFSNKTKPTVAILPLTGCFGCQVNLLDFHENFIDLKEMLDIKFIYFMDVKDIPEVDIGIVEGSVANSENSERLQILRERCNTLLALGTCACYGGLPGLRNLYMADDVINRAYIQSESTSKSGALPDSPVIPELNERVRAVSDVVQVDGAIPGCPSPHELIVDALNRVTSGMELEVPSHNLCFECQRTHKGMLTAKREYITDSVLPVMELPVIDPKTCFLEQGVLCMGMATREGCGARCLESNIPCRGCMGPAPQIKENGAKFVNALGSLLPVGALRFRHDLVGLGYRYTLPVSMMPGNRK